jgi:hypothetical protein
MFGSSLGLVRVPCRIFDARPGDEPTAEPRWALGGRSYLLNHFVQNTLDEFTELFAITKVGDNWSSDMVGPYAVRIAATIRAHGFSAACVQPISWPPPRRSPQTPWRHLRIVML